jgi:hypothetical protein
MTDINFSSFIRSVADLLRGDYKPGPYVPEEWLHN